MYKPICEPICFAFLPPHWKQPKERNMLSNLLTRGQTQSGNTNSFPRLLLSKVRLIRSFQGTTARNRFISASFQQRTLLPFVSWRLLTSSSEVLETHWQQNVDTLLLITSVGVFPPPSSVIEWRPLLPGLKDYSPSWLLWSQSLVEGATSEIPCPGLSHSLFSAFSSRLGVSAVTSLLTCLLSQCKEGGFSSWIALTPESGLPGLFTFVRWF